MCQMMVAVPCVQGQSFFQRYRFARGRVIGSSNSKGEVPRDNQVTPADLLVTLYRQMGLDPDTSFLNRAGRPITIGSTGRLIADRVQMNAIGRRLSAG